MRYWIIKGNPRENDLDDMLEAGIVDTWRTGKPPKNWLPGDRLFFWSSSPRLELVGLGELRGPTGERTRQGETLYEVEYLTDPVPTRVHAAQLRADGFCADANFLKPAVAQGVLEVPVVQARRMYSMLLQANPGFPDLWKGFAERSRQKSSEAEQDRSAPAQYGQGFGEAEGNALVEQAAISVVTKDYQRRGWKVRSVERDKCGYDLECRYGSSWQYVEVKGIRGSDCAFFLTAGELQVASTKADYVIVAVTQALSSPQLIRITPTELRQRFRLDPLAFRVVPVKRG